MFQDFKMKIGNLLKAKRKTTCDSETLNDELRDENLGIKRPRKSIN
jgi:hypothetical protein